MPQKKSNESITALLTQIGKIHRNKKNELLAEAGIHAGQDILLYFLSLEDGQTVSALVEKMCNQHATLFNMLVRMEANGMVRKEKDSMDKRTSRVYITSKGKKAYQKVTQTWVRLEATALIGINKEHAKLLESLLKKIQHNLS